MISAPKVGKKGQVMEMQPHQMAGTWSWSISLFRKFDVQSSTMSGTFGSPAMTKGLESTRTSIAQHSSTSSSLKMKVIEVEIEEIQGSDFAPKCPSRMFTV